MWCIPEYVLYAAFGALFLVAVALAFLRWRASRRFDALLMDNAAWRSERDARGVEIDSCIERLTGNSSDSSGSSSLPEDERVEGSGRESE